jgi:DNA polymerase-3 subunit gamma/tau
MAYKALYRTYRPTKFEEVYGQKHIVRTLSNALSENKIAHAYLFCGPRGTGKTTMARLFAKALNCEEGFGHQCNHCDNCIAINEGSHPDVIEIDAASNRGIDDIRDIIDKVKYAPIKGKYKVYIIDEVHMMTPEAFNALLKTLEEPPANVVFILATTEPYKLMPTILSRVQRYDFTKVSDKDLLGNLKRVCDSEGVHYDDKALELIVSLADGGVRDSLSMTDQAIAFSGNNLTLENVTELFGLSTLEEKVDLLTKVYQGKVLDASKKLDDMVDHGVDLKRLTQDLIEIVKDLLIFKTTNDYSILKVADMATVDSLDIPRIKLSKMIDILMDAYGQYRNVSNIKSLLEISLLKISSLSMEELDSPQIKVVEKVVEVVKDTKQNSIKEAKIEPTHNVVIDAPLPTPSPLPKAEEKKVVKKVSSEEFKDVEPLKDEGEEYILSEEDTINLMQQGNKKEKEELLEKWDEIEDYLDDEVIGKYANVLTKCPPRIVSEGVLVLEANFENIATKVKIKSNQNGFVQLIKKITGKEYTILVLSNQERVDRVQKFINLKQAGKLPDIYPVDIKF